MVLSGVNIRENSLIPDIIHQELIKVDNTWFLISDTKILWQQKLLYSAKDISFLYILIYDKITNFLTAPPNSLSGKAEVGPTSELVTKTAETLTQLFFRKKRELI